MKRVWRQFWQDDGGAIIAVEFLFIATILALGIIPGLVALRNAIVSEMHETAQAIDPDACPDPIVCTPPTETVFIDQQPCD